MFLISIDIKEIEDEDINDNIEFKYNMVFDSMGILQNGEEIWMKRLEEVKKYIDDNNKRPSEESEIKTVKTLGKWVSHQIQNYKNKNGIMKKQIIYNIWTEFINNEKYKKYFMSNEEKWKIKFLLLIKYINTYTKKPKNNEIYEGIILSRWITAQQKNYLNKKKIMSNQTIYKIHGHILLMMININNILYLMMINGLFNSIN